MEELIKIPLNEIKKKLNSKKAIIDFFRKAGKFILLLNI